MIKCLKAGCLEEMQYICRNKNRKWIIPSITIALQLGLLWNPMSWVLNDGANSNNHSLFESSEAIDSFDRIIGQTVLCGVDISKRILNLYFFGFLYIPLLFLITYFFLCWIFKKHNEFDQQALIFLNATSLSAFPIIIVQFFNRLSPEFIHIYSPSFFLIQLLIIFYLKWLSLKIDFNAFKCTLFLSLSITQPIIAILRIYNPSLLNNIKAKIITELLSILISFLLFLAFVWVGKTFSAICALTPFFFFMICSSILLELSNILNQHNVITPDKANMIISLFEIFLFASLLLYYKNLNREGRINWERICYPAMILGFSMLLVQPNMQITADVEMFERSNWGSDIVGLFSAAKIPVIENFNAHLFGEDIGGIIYSFFNGGPSVHGAYFSYNWMIPVFYILIYYLFCQFVEKDYAVLNTLFFPWYGMGTLIRIQDTIGLVCVLAAVSIVKKDSIQTKLLFCLTCALLCIYKADTALAFSIACIIVLTGVFIGRKKWKSLIDFWLIGLCTGGTVLSAFFILCMLKSISPISRLLEIVSILASNEKWAYVNVDTTYTFNFFLSYFLFPLLVFICLLAIIIKSKELRIKDSEILVVITLGISFFINFQRGIVRHNLLEEQWGIILYTAPLCIVLSLWIFKERKPLTLPIYLCGLLIVQIAVGSNNFSGSSLLQSSLNRQADESIYVTYQDKVDRVLYSQDLQNLYVPLKNFMDATLDDYETYLDFTDETLLYALLERDKPCYINQSPSLLSNEYSQCLFLSQIKESNCPYAILRDYGSGFDGVPRNISTYLVAEYIYNYYKPFYSINGFNIWVRNDKFQEKNLLAQLYIKDTADDIQRIDYLSEEIHTYDLKEVPYLWANYDKVENKELQTDWTGFGFDEPPKIQAIGSAPGQFTVTIENLPQNVSNVLIPIWCSSIEGQDDLIWYQPELVANKAILNVDIGSHKNQTGKYEIHIYVEINGEMLFWDGITATAGSNMLTCEEKIRSESSIVYFDPDSLISPNGNYLELALTSAENGEAILVFVDNIGNPLANWRFNIKQGENCKYLIRMSADYLWWSRKCCGFTLTIPNEETTFNCKYRFVKGDISNN